MSSLPDSPWIRMPQQARARRTFERVLDAGAELLAEQRYEAFSMSEVCRRASVSPGALYDRVDGKAALFLAIHQRELERITAAGQAAFAESQGWASVPTPELVTRSIEELAAHYLEERALLKVFILRAAVDDRVREEGSRMARKTESTVTALLLTRAADYPHPDPEAAVHMVFRIVADSLGWRTAYGLDFGTIGLETQEQWIDQLGAICRTYLLTPPT